MWYKIESKASIIYVSDKLIKINPDLSTDLCAEILTRSLGVSYSNLLSTFRNYETVNNRKSLKAYAIDNYPQIDEYSKENIVGCLLQKGFRKNITNTYFSYIDNNLLVSKSSENNLERRSINNEKVLSGTYLIPKLSEFINNNDVEGFESLFVASIESVFEKFKDINNPNLLMPEAVDCIAKNTIITEDGFDFFDIEYSPNMEFTKSHFFLRSVFGFHKQFIKKKNWPYKSPYELYLVFCKYFSIGPNVDKDIISEIYFRKTILDNKSKGLLKKELEQAFYNTKPFLLKLYRHIKNRFF